MIINRKHLDDIIQCVEEANSGYALLAAQSGTCSVKAIDVFSDYCRSVAKLEIYQHEHTQADGIPKGLVLICQNSYEIWILSGLNFCWGRFVLCKELFHVMIDVKDNEKLFANGDIENHIDQYLVEEINIDPKTTSPNNVQAELLAEIAAMEFMFPYTHRVSQKGKQSSEIAENYKLPKALVEKYMSDSFMHALLPPSHQ